ncbi:MAG: DUF424 family protein [Thermoprotei archaeon]
MISFGVHKTERGLILGICDQELLNKAISCKEQTIFVDPKFYGGNTANLIEIKRLIQNAYMVNILGSNAIKECITQNIIEDSWVKKICGIPHVQLIRENA